MKYLQFQCKLFSVMRQRKELEMIHSAHRFLGEFKDRELESYNVAPQMFNEFKGEGGPEVCLIKDLFQYSILFSLFTRISLT